MATHPTDCRGRNFVIGQFFSDRVCLHLLPTEIFAGKALHKATLKFSAQRAQWVSQEVWHENPSVGRAIRTSSGSLLGRCTAQASLYRNGDQHWNDSGPLRPRLPLVRTISCRYSCVTKFSLRLVMPPIYRKRLMAFTHIRDAWCGRAVPVPRY
ncbi:hypothetical protein DF054_06010 [Burkholderia cepacia]|nr:hypothetical protein DF055_06455 [Burkholderia cepacia]RRA12301.1 hypothetical protein DF054_06010 [Burkholderia cepacia]